MNRRDWLRVSTVGAVGFSMSGWLAALAKETAGTTPKKSCILLWMTGGPSQMDTFDLKPGHPNGGPFKETETNVPGLKISEHLPKIAQFGDRMAIIRGMSTKEGDHGRATYVMRTGYTPQGAIQYPTLGSLLAKELGHEAEALPSFISVAPYRADNPAAYGSGFLGPRYAPLIVGDTSQLAGGGGGGNRYDEALK